MLSSSAHVRRAIATGSWLGVGNDPVYVKSRCFETFPFPTSETGLTPALTARIACLAEDIDAHRKRLLQPTAVLPLPQRGRVGAGELRERNHLNCSSNCPHPRPPPLGEGVKP